MRFLLEYCNDYTKSHVEFSTIAEYFFRYYWLQGCKSKIRQAPQAQKNPEIIKIIEKEFDKPYYPHTYEKICAEEAEKIQKCIDKITKSVFHNVTWRFQRLKSGSSVKENRIFFDYKISREITPNKKYVDLDRGIDINSKAMEFFKKYNVILKKAVNLEWAKFLEKLNLGMPRLIQKIEGRLLQEDH